MPSISFSKDNTSGAFATALAVLVGCRGTVPDRCSKRARKGVVVRGVEADCLKLADMPRTNHSAPTLPEAIDAVAVLSHAEPGRIITFR